MMNILPITLLGVLLGIKTVLSQKAFQCGISQITINKLIVNGYNIVPGDWPWHVAIHHRLGNTETYACGGTLVTKLHIITAAHCVEDDYEEPLTVNDIFVRLGVSDLNLVHKKIELQMLRKIHRLDTFSTQDLRNDIAILELDSAVVFNKYIQPACVSLTEAFTGQLGTVVGFGLDESDQVSAVLKSAQLPVVDFYTCLKSDREAFGLTLDEGIFCAGYTNGTTVCNGDSGGGIFFKENGAWHLGGLVSFTKVRDDRSNRCFINSYGAFTKIHTYLEWIKMVTKLNLSMTVRNRVSPPVPPQARKAFYLESNMPFSIKRYEETPIQVTVFNFFEHKITAEITLFNVNNEFYFVQTNSTDANRSTKTVAVPSNSGKLISFTIKAKKLGEIAIVIRAINGMESDVVEYMLRVTPESHRYEGIEARFIGLNYYSTKTFNINIGIPQTIDENSVKIKFTLDPDLLEQIIWNLEGSLHTAGGSGETNTIILIKNVVILDYLSETRNVPEQVKSQAINFIGDGYQNQLTYKHSDGCFSAGGWRDSKGSTFLTVFVATALNMATKYINVDNRVIDEAFQWLASIQQADGQFHEVGRLYNPDMQGGMRSNNFALTSYVLIAFTENEDIAKKYREVVTRTMNFLAGNFRNISDPYDLALASYGMVLGKHVEQNKFFNKLLESSVFNYDKTVRFWEKSPFTIEIAGYAVLTYMVKGDYLSALPIMRWLNQQRYGLRRSKTTQDTVVGLKALAKMAEKLSPLKNDYLVQLKYVPDNKYTFSVDSSNANNSIMEKKIPDHVRHIDVEISGIGHGLFQVAYQYYQSIELGTHSYKLLVEVLNTTSHHMQQLKVCVAYIPKERYERSNMTVLEVFLPSGMIAYSNAVKDLSENREIKSFELCFGATSIVIYYDSLGMEQVCFEVTAFRKQSVAQQFPSYVVVYDYYHRDRFAIKEYS